MIKIYTRDSRLFQYANINQCNLPKDTRRLKKKNHMLILTNEEITLAKLNTIS